jgi:hypothetical protein
MSREVPFDIDEKCDDCGSVVAFDLMGDYICAECLKGYEARAGIALEQYTNNTVGSDPTDHKGFETPTITGE